jgi:hypothetical protein
MDALPPAPITSSTHASLLAALVRSSEADAWRIDLETAMAEAILGKPSDPERALKAFLEGTVVDAPGATPVTRLEAFAGRARQVMRDDANVQWEDGTLASDAYVLAMRYAGPGAMSGGDGSLSVSEVRLGGVDVPGIVVLADATTPTAYAVFTPRGGWQHFATTEDALEGIRDEWIGQRGAHGAGAPLSPDASVRLADDSVMTLAPCASSASCAGDIERTLSRYVAEAFAWPDDASPGGANRLRDRVAQATSLRPWLDTAALTEARERRVAIALADQRLARLRKPLAAEWRAAAHAYATAVLGLAASPPMLSLHAFTRERVVDALRLHGVHDAPEALLLRRQHSASKGTQLVTWNEDTPLLDAALQGIGWLNIRPLSIVTTSGERRISHDDTIPLLRALDIHARYPLYVDELWRTSPTGAHQRDAAMHALVARMRFELEDARATMYLDNEPGDLLPDHGERGYQFVRAILDGPMPGQRATVDGHVIEVRQLDIDGARLQDVLEIGAKQTESVSRVIIYTPGAPDGQAFREFADRGEAFERFFAQPRFARYLAARLPDQWSSVASDGSSRRFCIRCASGIDDAVPWTKGSVITPVPLHGDFRAAVYDAAIARVGLEAARATRPNGEADVDDARLLAYIAVDAGLGLAPLRVSMGLAAIRGLHAAWQGSEAIAADDQVAAAHAFATAMASVGEVAATHAAARVARRSVFAGAGAARSMRRSARVALPSEARALPFPRRYRAHGIDPTQLQPGAAGVLKRGSQTLIVQDGVYFHASWDPDNATWRLVDTTRPAGYQPPIAWREGRWVANRHVGLLGGMGDRPDDLFEQSPLSTLERFYTGAASTETLAPSQRRALAAALRSPGDLTDAAMTKIIYDGIHGRARGTTLRRWEAALTSARAIPAAQAMPPLPVAPPDPGYQLVKVERSQWPDRVYHYTKRSTYDEHFAGLSGDLYLHESMPTAVRPPGVHVMTLDHTAPTDSIATIMRGPAWVTMNRGNDVYKNLAGAYIEIDLRALGDRQRHDGTYEFNLYSVTHRSPYQFVIRPTEPSSASVGDPPSSPRRSVELRAVRLRPGDYNKGTRQVEPDQTPAP